MKAFVLILGCLCCAFVAHAQVSTFEEFRKQERSRFEIYRQQQRSEFEEYRQKRNKEFADYLAKKWKDIDVYKGMIAPAFPKPFVPQPEPDSSVVKNIPRQLLVKQIKTAPPVVPKVKPVKIDVPVSPEDDRCITVTFLGSRCKIHTLQSCDITLTGIRPADISAGWKNIATEQTDLLVYDCQQLRDELQLCDYAYYLLIKQVALSVLGDQKINEAVLLSGYILAQSGIDFRFATDSRSLILALPFDVTVYGKSYYTIGGRKYYLMDREHVGSIQIVPDAYSPEAEMCHLAFSAPMHLSQNMAEPRHLASEKYPELEVDVSGNRNLMDLYSQYPRVDWAVYANVPLDETTKKRLLSSLGNVVSGKTEEETVNMLLNFVQTTFVYGYDDEIWGDDRPFFADETLFYSYSDCEDRAILFSQLVRMFTPLDVVLLHYPNHLATAVRFTRDFSGDYVLVDGHKYFVCDPTGYKPIGHAYDEFKDVKAEVIRLNAE